MSEADFCFDEGQYLADELQYEREHKYDPNIKRIKNQREETNRLNDLINRQQAEIVRLRNLTEKDFEQTAISTVKRHQKWIEYRAVKEFAERLKEKASCCVAEQNGQEIYGTKTYTISAIELDNLAKEMVGDAE